MSCPMCCSIARTEYTHAYQCGLRLPDAPVLSRTSERGNFNSSSENPLCYTNLRHRCVLSRHDAHTLIVRAGHDLDYHYRAAGEFVPLGARLAATIDTSNTQLCRETPCTDPNAPLCHENRPNSSLRTPGRGSPSINVPAERRGAARGDSAAFPQPDRLHRRVLGLVARENVDVVVVQRCCRYHEPVGMERCCCNGCRAIAKEARVRLETRHGLAIVDVEDLNPVLLRTTATVSLSFVERQSRQDLRCKHGRMLMNAERAEVISRRLNGLHALVHSYVPQFDFAAAAPTHQLTL
jgi:hypothetical protein